MKRLLIILLVVELALIVLLALPLLHKRASYEQAQTAYRKEATLEAAEAWAAEQSRRDRQVMLAFGGVAALCVNSCALCLLFGRFMADEPRRPRRKGTFSAAARRKLWLARGLLVVSLAAVGVGGAVFARALADPSPRGLWALVTVLAGGVGSFVAVLWWTLARQVDQPRPVDEG